MATTFERSMPPSSCLGIGSQVGLNTNRCGCTRSTANCPFRLPESWWSRSGLEVGTSESVVALTNTPIRPWTASDIFFPNRFFSAASEEKLLASFRVLNAIRTDCLYTIPIW